MSFIVGRVKPDQKETVSLKERPDPLGVTSRLQAYFDGQLDALSTIPVDPGGTVFQQQVWTALRAIPAGTVLSYSTLAARLEKPGASRAVGSANARNPIAIIIPCHRIIGASGELTGYAWGTERKRWLLQHEGVAIAPADVDQLTLPM
jgi:methylated-DNA-[protein]-cysteine S-methyltransferase